MTVGSDANAKVNLINEETPQSEAIKAKNDEDPYPARLNPSIIKSRGSVKKKASFTVGIESTKKTIISHNSAAMTLRFLTSNSVEMPIVISITK